MLRTLVPST